MYLFYLEDNYLTNLQWFLPYVEKNQPQIYMCHPCLKTQLTPISPLSPSGFSPKRDFGCPASCINLTLIIYFAYVNVYFSVLLCNTYHCHLLPLSPEVCS